MNPDQDSPTKDPIKNDPSSYYLYRQHQQYGASPQTNLYRWDPNPYAAPALSVAKKPFLGIDDRPQTVEDLIDHGYFAAPASEPEFALIDDKLRTSRLGLDDVLGQIGQRDKIYKQNMLDIEWAKCYAFNELASGGWPTSKEQETIYHRRLQDLHSEQRAERVAAWRDTSRLRQLLPESLQLYLSSQRKAELLDDRDGDMP